MKELTKIADVINTDKLREVIQNTVIQTALNEHIGPSDKTEDMLVSRTLESMLYSYNNAQNWAANKIFEVYREAEDLRNSDYAGFDTVIAKIEGKETYMQQLEVQDAFYTQMIDGLQMAYLDITGNLWKPRGSFNVADAKVDDTSAGMELTRYREKFAERLKAMQERAEEDEAAEAKADAS